MHTDRKVMCSYCNKPAKLKTGKQLYPHRPDLADIKMWVCIPCNARVGIYKNSKSLAPKGTLANKELRILRIKVHELFDPMWKKGKRSRTQAYVWLSHKLRISPEKCHVGMFNKELCIQAIKILKERK